MADTMDHDPYRGGSSELAPLAAAYHKALDDVTTPEAESVDLRAGLAEVTQRARRARLEQYQQEVAMARPLRKRLRSVRWWLLIATPLMLIPVLLISLAATGAPDDTLSGGELVVLGAIAGLVAGLAVIGAVAAWSRLVDCSLYWRYRLLLLVIDLVVDLCVRLLAAPMAALRACRRCRYM